MLYVQFVQPSLRASLTLLFHSQEELKAQQKHAKFTRVEHKARLRFLKEKERYERVEAQLRSIEADYEAKREHAAQQTDLLAEKTQELNDLRAQKAADDVSPVQGDEFDGG